MKIFRSVFAKYVVAFMALLTASFLLLLFIVNSMVSREASRTKQRQLAQVAGICAEQLTGMYEADGDSTELLVFFTQEEVKRLLSAVLASHEDMTMYVTDEGGDFLFSTGKIPVGSPAEAETLFSPAELRDSLTDAGLALDAETDHGRLSIPYSGYAYLMPLRTEQGCIGYLLLSADEPHGDAIEDTLQSMMAAALWIMLAALIAIYFVTERVISPLRDMSKAAKRMAVGKFDVRVPVRGRDEVAELAVAFNQMSGALDNLERMRNSFVANVSHDLRTPMTTIAGFIDGILDGVIPPEQERHYLKVVSDEVRRLSRLVTALLDLSRLQAGDRKFDMQPFDVCEMGRQILISFEKKIDEKMLDVEFACDEDRMFVLADRDAIHQILYNICDNAVKFASVKGKLKMSFSWSESESNRRRKAVVRIYNEGQGIPAEDLPFVFDRFYKSDKSRSLDKSGVGLGMFISKTIIEAHDETISVASEYGQYCEFTFTLARTDPPALKGRAGTV